ncbi:hypothetical protein [Bombiscardovia coagulans]|uniref:DUF4190 domain-containing protein n=1 Tax=Bombiscardovia coagulans TaxID=686666 RepID=A0A261ET93_9BIFI|nr:hypothetical protein [Bombiscardovia coagulans]OZG50078.1 hypothetical protein BOCO_0595 [Bombiscardovia coagulans]
MATIKGVTTDTEQEQNPVNNGQVAGGLTGNNSPVSTSALPSQPEYGALKQEYPGWNPYIFGQADPEPQPDNIQQPVQVAQNEHPLPGGNPQIGTSYQPAKKHMMNGINLDDPRQNPAYGRWDPCAIIAFITTLCLPIPFIPALMGAIAMYRTKTFHMKGFGLALAAVIINLLYSFFVVWMSISGFSVNDVYQQMMQSMVPAPDESGGDQITASV